MERRKVALQPYKLLVNPYLVCEDGTLGQNRIVGFNAKVVERQRSLFRAW